MANDRDIDMRARHLLGQALAAPATFGQQQDALCYLSLALTPRVVEVASDLSKGLVDVPAADQTRIVDRALELMLERTDVALATEVAAHA